MKAKHNFHDNSKDKPIMNKIASNINMKKHQIVDWKRKITDFRKPDTYDIFIICAILIYAIIFSYLSLFRYNTFQLEYDLAIFNQALWNTVINGEILTNSLENGSHFGVHFSPILFSLFPFYALSPGSHILLIFQSIFLALGAIPIYICGREILGKKIGVILGCIYLLYPSLHGVNLYDFHELSFLPFLLGLTIWGLITKRKNLLLLFGLTSLLVKEDVALIIFMTGIIGLYQTKGEQWVNRWQYIILSVIPICILGIFFCFIKPAFIPSDSMISGHLLQYMNPLDNFAHYNENRFLYMLITFLPLLFMPLFSPQIFVISVPSFLEILISPVPYYYSIYYQYSALVIPVLFMATIMSLSKVLLKKGWLGNFEVKPLIYMILTITLLSSYLFSPAVILLKNMDSIDHEIVYDHRDKVMQVLSIIPKDSSIATQYNLLPIVSSRKQIWLDYNHQADVILIDTTYQHRSSDFNDNLDTIKENFKLMVNWDNILLYVKMDDNELISKIQDNFDRVNTKNH